MFRNFNNIIDFDNLIFENRNKEYGAFLLRKKYKGAVIIGIVVASLFAALAIVLPFALSFNSDKALSGNLSYYSVQMDGLAPPIDEIIMPLSPPPPPRNVELVHETVRYAPPVIADTILPDEYKFATMDEVLSEPIAEDLSFDVIGNGDEFSSGIFGGVGGDGYGDGTFTYVEILPSFRGGDENGFREWVQRRIIYPQAALDAKIQGRVFVTFTIEQDGSVTNVVIIQGIGALVDDEVVRVIQSSPKWSPAFRQGYAVSLRRSMWFNFIL